jgi:hypothetical protein
MGNFNKIAMYTASHPGSRNSDFCRFSVSRNSSAFSDRLPRNHPLKPRSRRITPPLVYRTGGSTRQHPINLAKRPGKHLLFTVAAGLPD